MLMKLLLWQVASCCNEVGLPKPCPGPSDEDVSRLRTPPVSFTLRLLPECVQMLCDDLQDSPTELFFILSSLTAPLSSKG